MKWHNDPIEKIILVIGSCNFITIANIYSSNVILALATRDIYVARTIYYIGCCRIDAETRIRVTFGSILIR